MDGTGQRHRGGRPVGHLLERYPLFPHALNNLPANDPKLVLVRSRSRRFGRRQQPRSQPRPGMGRRHRAQCPPSISCTAPALLTPWCKPSTGTSRRIISVSYGGCEVKRVGAVLPLHRAAGQCAGHHDSGVHRAIPEGPGCDTQGFRSLGHTAACPWGLSRGSLPEVTGVGGTPDLSDGGPAATWGRHQFRQLSASGPFLHPRRKQVEKRVGCQTSGLGRRGGGVKPSFIPGPPGQAWSRACPNDNFPPTSPM